MCEILCIGHAAYDITYSSDSFLKENVKYETEFFIECGGGPAANAAVLLSSWGIKTAFAGVIGNDYYGTRLIDEFKNVGDRKSTRLNSSHIPLSRMPSSA